MLLRCLTFEFQVHTLKQFVYSLLPSWLSWGIVDIGHGKGLMYIYIYRYCTWGYPLSGFKGLQEQYLLSSKYFLGSIGTLCYSRSPFRRHTSRIQKLSMYTYLLRYFGQREWILLSRRDVQPSYAFICRTRLRKIRRTDSTSRSPEEQSLKAPKSPYMHIETLVTQVMRVTMCTCGGSVLCEVHVGQVTCLCNRV